jgi:Tol biopolymer transport system component
LVYVVGSAESTEPKRSLVWVDLNGKEKPLAAAPDAYVGPRISPDGTKLALGIASSDNTDIYIWDIARETMTRLTFDEAADNFPLWSSDRQRVAFSSDRGGKQGVYWKKADGTGETELLASAPNRFIAPWAWSGDGKIIVLLEYALAENSNFDIGLLSMEGDRELKLLLHEKYMELPSLISPDGQWMAYTSIEAELPEVFVRPFPDVDKGKWQVSKEGGTNPLWSPDGREIFYRTMDGGVMKVDVESKPSFKLGNPELLFSGNYDRLSPESGQAWDISPDGKKFIMMKPAVSADASSKPEELQQINLVLNWFEELKQRVPAK